MRFASIEHLLRMDALLRSQSASFSRAARWSVEEGPGILVTNLSAETLRRLARLDDVRLPDYVRLPDDDPIVLDVVKKWVRRGCRTDRGAQR